MKRRGEEEERQGGVERGLGVLCVPQVGAAQRDGTHDEEEERDDEARYCG